MSPVQEKEEPFEDRMESAVTSLEALGAEGAFYDRDALLGSHSVVTELAEEGLGLGELDQIKTLDTKLTATTRAREIARANSDATTDIALGHLEQTLSTLKRVLEGQDQTSEPATTSRSRSGGAKARR